MSMKVVSLFSGGGGLDLGFKECGFDIIWANDMDKEAVSTYKENIGNHIVLGDITKIKEESIPQADVLIGGPPCQSFSLVGKRDEKDPRGELVWHYIRILKHVNPNYFIFENVVGLKSAKTKDGKSVIDELIHTFKDIGYSVKWEVINAADFGIPQRRKRIIIVGYKNGFNFSFPNTTHNENGTDGKLKWVSVSDALDDISEPTIEGIVNYKTLPMSDYQIKMRDGNGDLDRKSVV